MTGRELIIFILENNLENVSIFDGDTLPGLMTLDEAAVKWHSGRNTLKALFEMGKIPGVIIDEKIYIHKSVENPFSKKGKDHDKDDTFDPEKGLAMAISKYFFDNAGYFNDVFKKWIPKKGESNEKDQ